MRVIGRTRGELIDSSPVLRSDIRRLFFNRLSAPSGLSVEVKNAYSSSSAEFCLYYISKKGFRQLCLSNLTLPTRYEQNATSVMTTAASMRYWPMAVMKAMPCHGNTMMSATQNKVVAILPSMLE